MVCTVPALAQGCWMGEGCIFFPQKVPYLTPLHWAHPRLAREWITKGPNHFVPCEQTALVFLLKFICVCVCNTQENSILDKILLITNLGYEWTLNERWSCNIEHSVSEELSDACCLCRLNLPSYCLWLMIIFNYPITRYLFPQDPCSFATQVGQRSFNRYPVSFSFHA